MRKDLLICGVGGQGVVLSSRLIARAAMARDLAMRTAETIGMAQRGGSVVSHVRIGHCHSPLIPVGRADALIALEPGEAARNLRYLKPGGLVIANTNPVDPVTAALAGSTYRAEEILGYIASRADLIKIDAEAIGRSAGAARAANVVLIGAAAALGVLGLQLWEIEAALSDLGGKYLAINQSALRLGAQAILEGGYANEDE